MGLLLLGEQAFARFRGTAVLGLVVFSGGSLAGAAARVVGVARVGVGVRGLASPGSVVLVLRVPASVGVEDLLLVSQLVWVEEKEGPGESREECAERLFGMPPERAARGSLLLAGLEDIAERFGRVGGG